MNNWGWMFGAGCLIAAGCAVLVQRHKVRKTMNMLDRMIDCAMDGTFTESTFDESMLSALETRFAHYLSAATISARNVSQEKDRIKALIADISHQTKTPIANLLLYTELLQEETLSKQAHEYADMLHVQTEKLYFLIDALVKLSRLENGIIALNPVREPVMPMLKQIIQQFEQKASEKGLSLRLDETDAVCCMDAKWTSEALGNLVDNAIKYTQTGGVTISVTAYEMFVRIDVKDTGIGIREEEQSKIFARFYRLEQNRQQEGVGIGLYLARQILKSEDGYIKVSSKEGKGSVFSIFLPR